MHQPSIKTFPRLRLDIKTDHIKSTKWIHPLNRAVETLYTLQSDWIQSGVKADGPFCHYQHGSSDAHNGFSLFNSGDSLLRTEEITAQNTGWLFTRTCLCIFNGLLALRVWTNTSPPYISLHCEEQLLEKWVKEDLFFNLASPRGENSRQWKNLKI